MHTSLCKMNESIIYHVHFTLVVECGHPGNGVNATLITDPGYNEGDELEYICVGYHTTICMGNYRIQCQPDGKWSVKPPVCG